MNNTSDTKVTEMDSIRRLRFQLKLSGTSVLLSLEEVVRPRTGWFIWKQTRYWVTRERNTRSAAVVDKQQQPDRSRVSCVHDVEQRERETDLFER